MEESHALSLRQEVQSQCSPLDQRRWPSQNGRGHVKPPTLVPEAMHRLGEIFVEEGSKAIAAQGGTSMSSEAAKATLQEACHCPGPAKRRNST